MSAGSPATYINFSGGGFQYRLRADTAPHRNGQPSESEPSTAHQTKSSSENFENNRSKDDFRNTNGWLLKKINVRIAQGSNLAPVVIFCFLSVFVGLIVLFRTIKIDLNLHAYIQPQNFNFGLFLAFLLFLFTGSLYCFNVHRKDRLKRTTELIYELEGTASKRRAGIHQAFESLARSSTIWRVENSSRNQAETFRILREQPPYLSTNIDVWSLNSHRLSCYFLPDFIFVWHKKKYYVVGYDSINLSLTTGQRTAAGVVPRDAKIVGHTYQFTRKDGNPDLRYKHNPSFAVIEYGFLEIKSNAGLDLMLQISNLSAAQNFVRFFEQEVLTERNRKEPSSRNQQQKNQNQQQSANQKNNSSGRWQKTNTDANQNPPPKNSSRFDEKIKSAHEILEVKLGANKEQITAAYREQAKSYHPDKVMQASPKIAKLAEEKMKQINLAFQTLKDNNFLD